MLIPPGFANVQLGGINPTGRTWLTACGCALESWDPSNLDDVGTYLGGEQWVDGFLAEGYFIKVVRVIVGTADPTSPLVYEQVVNVEGGGDEGASPNTAILVTKRTNLGGRHGRGRCFFPGPQEAGVDGSGHIVGALASDPSLIEDFWPDLFTSLELGDAYLLHADDSHDPSLIVSFTMSTLVSTQRRRLRG